MKVLMINGSPKSNGNTARALAEMRAVLEAGGVEVELVQVGHLAVRGCTGCAACYKIGHCVTEDIVSELAAKLAEMIKANDNRMTTGFVGTPYILHVLSDNGYTDLAYELLFQEQNPSWLYSVCHGATTMWEHWNSLKEDGSFWSTDMNSFNHYAYGAVVDWMYGVCAGIAQMFLQCEDGKVKILPALPSEMKQGSIKGLLAKGNITVDIEWKNNKATSVKLVTPFEQTAIINIDGADIAVALKANEIYTVV